jgi:threonine dehydrogenase-like Zn-dependent dehydrogenase
MTESNGVTTAYDVAVLGCGLMGAALVRALAKTGRSVAVWNRTPDRAEALAGDGVTPIRTVGDAVQVVAIDHCLHVDLREHDLGTGIGRRLDWCHPGQPRERRRRRARRRTADATFDPRSSASATPGVFTTTVAAPSAAASAPIRPI